MTSEHDEYIDDLIEIIKGSYLNVLKNFIYKNDWRVLGEVDVVGIGHNQFDLYEVKSSKTRRSMSNAVEQLQSSRNYLGQRGNEFIYTPNYGIETIDDIIKDLAKEKWKK